MHHSDILWNPRFTHALVRQRKLADDELVLVNVGMRGGIPQQWTMFGDQLRVIGFEPDQAECRALNEAKTEWRQICFPVCLDREPRTRKLFSREQNRAADGFYHATWWSSRFGVAAPGDAKHGVALAQRWHTETPVNERDVQTTTYAAIAEANQLPRPDFIKIDAEGAELDILKGCDRFLDADGVIGVECKTHFTPNLASPLFLDLAKYLESRGYQLYTLSPYRYSRKVLPMPVAWDHRDHEGNPLMRGPTQRGQLHTADVVFFRDLIADGQVVRPGDRNALRRVLKAAAMLELYNMPDCAAELLIHYRQALVELIDVDAFLAQLVPDLFGRPVSHREYLDLYVENLGRL